MIKTVRKRTYNANYVTYRGKGSNAKTKDVFIKNNWVGVTWE